MTSIALIADIHGNLPALEAVFSYINVRGVTDIYCLGDIIGKGPSSAEAVDAVFTRCKGVISGNWELELNNNNDNHVKQYYRNQLGCERQKMLSSLQRVLFLSLGCKRIKLFHGRPDVRVIYSYSPREERLAALNAMGDSTCDIACFADVHAPFIQMLDARMLMNTGSVGNTCDSHRSASIAFIHYCDITDTLSAEIARIPYNIERAVSDALDTPDLPYLDEYIKELRTARHVKRGKVILC